MENLAGQAGLPLPDDEVHLWRFSLQQPAQRLEQLRDTLAADELERSSRFHFPEHRARFIAARGIMRAILAAYTRVDAARLSFEYGPFGKPALAGLPAEQAVDFNLAHTHGEGLLAVSHGRAIGVDIEHIREDVAYSSLAQRFFSPAEAAALLNLDEPLRQMAFFRCWTRKEAYIKAIGRGLFAQLDSFDVSLAPDEPPALRATRPDATEAGRWGLYDIEAGAGCAGALAVWGGAHRLVYYQWQPV